MTAETDTARPVVEWLRDLRYEVYQEVSASQGVADIVARQGRLIWVVEAKQKLGLSVIDQARRWLGHAHRVSVAVPKIPARTGAIARDILDRYGIGLFNASGGHGGRCHHMGTPLHRAVVPGVRDYWDTILADYPPDYCEAGSAGGGYWSPFKGTVTAAVRYVSNHPGCTMRELVAGIEHHYNSDKSARSHLPRYIDAGIIDKLRVDRETRPARIWLAVQSA